MSSVLAGLDVGTSAVKALLVTEEGAELARGRAAVPWRSTADGTELDALELFDAACEALRQALEQTPEAAVAGLGVASMAETGVLLDRRGRPLAPMIAWHDHRDAGEVEELRTALGAEAFMARTGLTLRPKWSLTKHRWLRRRRPSTRTAARRLNVAEWIVKALGGQEASEQSLASRTGWLDLAACRWWDDALEWSGASPALLPPLVTAGTPLGKASGAAGLPEIEGAVLTVAGHDHQVAAVGAHAAGPGDVLDSCGTAEALVRTIPSGLASEAVAGLVERGVTVGWHVLADRWCLLGGTRGGLALRRLLDLLGLTWADLAALDQRALRADTAAANVEVGDRAQISVGIDGDGVGPAEVWRAGLEVVAEAAAARHRAMHAVVGPHRRLTVVGGWSRSEAFMAIRRRVFGELTRGSAGEPGARGAALFAGLAAGIYASPGDFPRPAAKEPAR